MNEPNEVSKGSEQAINELRMSIAAELDPQAFRPMTSTWDCPSTAREMHARRITACNKAAAIINCVIKVLDVEYAAAFAGKVASA